MAVQGNGTGNGTLASNSLRSDHITIIKEADKGSVIVVWDREDYTLEAENQLWDPVVYHNLDECPSALV